MKPNDATQSKTNHLGPNKYVTGWISMKYDTIKVSKITDASFETDF